MNKNVLLSLNVLLLILVAILFYLHFTSTTKKAPVVAQSSGSTTAPAPFKIAYFELDSIENNYSYFKDIRNELKAKENQLNSQMSALKNRYMEKVGKFQQEAQSMSQERQGAMQQDLLQEQKVIQNKEQAMGNELQDATFTKMQNVNKAIEEYLAEFNKNKEYAFILGYQPGTIYYKDKQFDITDTLLKGLNERYKTKK